MKKITNFNESLIFIDQNKKYLKGNLHTHTKKSDGYYDLNDVIKIYSDNNYDFLGITDHDVFCKEQTNSDLVLLHGIECSCMYEGNDETKGAYAHFCCFLPKKFEHKIQYYKNVNELQECINNLSLNYPLIQFNHPLFSCLLDNEFLELNGYHLIEVYNHKDFCEETGILNAELLIRNFLKHKKQILITAGDDFHGPYNKNKIDKCFAGYIMVNANKDEMSIIEAIRNGDFYASMGPEILDYRLDKGILKVKTSPVKNIIFNTSGRKCKNIFNRDNSDINEGFYEIKENDYFVWMKATDSNGKSAWSQPIYIEKNNKFF